MVVERIENSCIDTRRDIGNHPFLLFEIKVPPANTVDRHIKNGIGVIMGNVVAGEYARPPIYSRG
jgi:hypothetical protein